MKQKLAIILAAILVLTLSTTLIILFSNRKQEGVIRVHEVTHSIFYAPFYIAMTQGYFKDEGFDIDLITGGGSDGSMQALVSGDVDVSLMGPETGVYVATGEALDKPKFFAQLTQRDGSIIIGREQNDNFELSDLVGKTIIGGRQGGMPAMTLRYVIENAGYEIGTEPHQVNLRDDVAFDAILSVYEQTNADYATLFEPVASAAILAGKGYRMTSVGSLSGDVPFTAFAAKQSFINKNPETIKGFIRAIIRGYEYLTTADIDDVVTALKPQFETTADIDIKNAVLSYIAIDAWSANPVMTAAAFDTLQNIIMNDNKITEKIEMDLVVDNTLANQVLEELAA